MWAGWGATIDLTTEGATWMVAEIMILGLSVSKWLYMYSNKVTRSVEKTMECEVFSVLQWSGYIALHSWSQSRCRLDLTTTSSTIVQVVCMIGDHTTHWWSVVDSTSVERCMWPQVVDPSSTIQHRWTGNQLVDTNRVLYWSLHWVYMRSQRYHYIVDSTTVGCDVV